MPIIMTVWINITSLINKILKGDKDMTFKEKLVKLRKLKGITQDEFASAVGVSRQAVYKWESGQSYPEVSKLLEIKALFNISIDDLLDDSYEVVLPEKSKKKLSAARRRAIEEAVENEESSAGEAPFTVAETVAEPAHTSEDPIPEAVVAENKAEPQKRGFFSRIFGR